MKIKLVVVGKLKEKYLKDGIAEYVKRMGTMLPLEIIELADEKKFQIMLPKKKQRR